MGESKNLFLAIILSITIIFTWELMFVRPQIKEIEKNKQIQENNLEEISNIEQDISFLSYQDAINGSDRVTIDSDIISGSINLIGARIDHLVLKKYKNEKDSDENVILLSPSSTKESYFIDFGWLSKNDIKLPDRDTIWYSNKKTLRAGSNITLSWDNNEGQKFHRKIFLDKNYMFYVEDTVENYSKKSVNLQYFGLANKAYDYKKQRFFILHEGAIAGIGDKIHEEKYKKLFKKGKVINYEKNIST